MKGYGFTHEEIRASPLAAIAVPLICRRISKIPKRKIVKQHNYFVYITTNPKRTVLYIGMTNDLYARMQQHFENAGDKKSFAGRYFCYNLIYWERFGHIDHAIDREKEIKKWNRKKKEKLINSTNPKWRFLNDEI